MAIPWPLPRPRVPDTRQLEAGVQGAMAETIAPNVPPPVAIRDALAPVAQSEGLEEVLDQQQIRQMARHIRDETQFQRMLNGCQPMLRSHVEALIRPLLPWSSPAPVVAIDPQLADIEDLPGALPPTEGDA